MANPDTGIPEEVLRSEQKPASPSQNDKPSILGLPGLPPAILDLAVQYGPVLVLAAAVLSGFSAVSILTGSAADPSATGLLPLSAFLSLAASAAMVLAYVWLTQKRRIGWNTLALALIIQFLGQILVTGVSSVLYTGIAILITTYVMLQLRDLYPND